jgi:hypothetical protein
MLSSDIPASQESSDLVPLQLPAEATTPPEIAAIGLADAPPDDYLESSEELLRSLAQEEAKVKVERTFLDYLSTPLGVGSMVLLLLSSALLGYVTMNPAILGGLLMARQEETAPAPAAPGNAPPYPPLNSQEFVDLGLNNLTALPSRSNPTVPLKPSSQPSPAATAAPTSPTLPPAIAPRVNVPVTAPSPAQQESLRQVPGPEPAPESSTSVDPAPAAPPVMRSRPAEQAPPPIQAAPAQVTRTQSGGYEYKVEIPFTGDQSLAEAKKAVPDAYLRPDGKIQMGAVGSEAEAKARIGQLKRQGISAEVKRR